MKKNFILLSILVITLVAAFSFRTVQPTITGKVSPADAAQAVWAINSTDSVRSAITGGIFTFTVKPGKYRVIVDAKEPRRDVILENIEVGNQPVDLGEIVIQ
ncbi:MAG: carboxypeptidase regulatory-like domain-containing protein [Chitinophagaceae bacterium]|nr:MAG: carboxypeptidase regulatory-like domain-containing protein [Chitinophagaceae bacterium]